MELDYEVVEERLRSLDRHVVNVSNKSACDKIVKQRKKSNLRVKYNMSLEEHECKVRSQGNMCAICGSEFGESKASMPHVDHCHETGIVRDLLCLKCNTALGSINEDIDIAKNIIKYLQKWS